MIYRSTQEDVKNYYDNPALNQSLLKTLEKGVNAFMEAKENPSDSNTTYFKVGSGVDTLLTLGEEAFQNEFYVSTLEKQPSASELNVIEEVKNQVDLLSLMSDSNELSDTLSNYVDIIKDAVQTCSYQSNWKLDTRVNKIIDNCSDYWKMLVESNGKTILTEEESTTIRDCVNRVKDSKVYGYSLDPQKFEKSEADHIYFQLPIYFDYPDTDIHCKAMLDCVRIYRDGDKMTVYPFDLKTTSAPLIKFPDVIEKFRYDIQADFYREALRQFLYQKYRNSYYYEIKPFCFVAVSTSEQSSAAIFRLISGYRPDDAPDYKYLMNKYAYQLQHNDFVNDMELIEKDYVYDINDYIYDADTYV